MPTMKDIAMAVNVSKTTVSNVFAGNDARVSPEVKKQILQLAEEMKYKPNKIAKALVENRSEIICVLLEQNNALDKHIYQALISGVLTGSSNFGYKVLLDPVYDRNQKSHYLSNNDIYDGAIIQAPALDDNRVGELLDENIPFVVIGQLDKKSDNIDKIMLVDVDNVKIAYDITSLLIKKGHRKIGFLNSMPNLTITFDRLSGYVQALADNGISFSPSFVYNTDNTKITGYTCGTELFKSNQGITAVVTCSDDVAVGLYTVLAENNLKAGEDVAIFALGGDDYSETLTPRISTVKIDYFQIGKIASEMLIKSLNKLPVSSNHVIVDVDYIITDSI